MQTCKNTVHDQTNLNDKAYKKINDNLYFFE